MIYDIRCRSGLNLVRDSEVTCGSVPHYHEKVLAGISLSVASSEIFLELCPAGFGVLLSSVVLSCRLTP